MEKIVNHNTLISYITTVFLLLFLPLSGLVLPVLAEEDGSDRTEEIWVAQVHDAIHPMVSEYLKDIIIRAEEKRIRCLIIELDTPGGLLESTREIVRLEMNAGIPIVVYVSPRGARAASAGMFITIASHVAAMAPVTNIGAAHPVSLGPGGMDDGDEDREPSREKDTDGDLRKTVAGESGSDSGVMEQKIMNDTLAWARGIAEERDRNMEWVEASIVDSISSTAREALEEGVIDLICESREDLITALNGRTVTVSGSEIVINLDQVIVVEKFMTFRQRFLSIIINPNIAIYLMTFGLLGIYIEITHPGFIFPGVVGGICLIMGFFAMHTLPINYAGLFLILLAFGFFAAEVKIPSYGILTVGGITAFILGASMLIDTEIPGMEISLKAIFPLALGAGLITVFLLSLIVKSHGKKSATGRSGMVGACGEVTRRLAPDGQIFVHGEIWKARGKDGMIIEEGVTVEVIAADGLALIVKQTDQK